MEQIEFVAVVARVQTMADGGLRFTFDASESMVLPAAQLMECKRFGAVLRVICTPSSSSPGYESREIYSDDIV